MFKRSYPGQGAGIVVIFLLIAIVGLLVYMITRSPTQPPSGVEGGGGTKPTPQQGQIPQAAGVAPTVPAQAASPTPIPPPPPKATAVPPASIPSPIPVSAEIVVAGYAQNGVKFSAGAAGSYAITIKSGTYSPWPTDKGANSQWRTLIYIYKNRAVDWAPRISGSYRGIEPSKPDAEIGYWEIAGEAEDAAAARARGTSISISLQAGDSLTLVPIDEQPAYSGNRGQVILSIQH